MGSEPLKFTVTHVESRALYGEQGRTSHYVKVRASLRTPLTVEHNDTRFRIEGLEMSFDGGEVKEWGCHWWGSQLTKSGEPHKSQSGIRFTGSRQPNMGEDDREFLAGRIRKNPRTAHLFEPLPE